MNSDNTNNEDTNSEAGNILNKCARAEGTYNIVGLRLETFVNQIIDESDYEIKCRKFEDTRHVFCLVGDNRKIELTFSIRHGMCPSGYTTAQYCETSIKDVKSFTFTHTPKRKLIIVRDLDNLFKDNRLTIKVDGIYIVDSSADGDDEYYPHGFYHVNMNLFRESPRYMGDKRPVWIFKGDSGLGKTYLANNLDDVYETDSSPKLPTIITNSVVVIGNKYPFTTKQVCRRLFGNVKVIMVDFHKRYYLV